MSNRNNQRQAMLAEIANKNAAIIANAHDADLCAKLRADREALIEKVNALLPDGYKRGTPIRVTGGRYIGEIGVFDEPGRDEKLCWVRLKKDEQDKGSLKLLNYNHIAYRP